MIMDCSGGEKNSVKHKIAENVFCLTRIQGEANPRVVKESHQITQLLDSSRLELKFSNIFKYSFQQCSKMYLVEKHLSEK